MFHSLMSKSIAPFVARGVGPTSESGEIREPRPTSSVSGLDNGVGVTETCRDARSFIPVADMRRKRRKITETT